MDNALDPMAIDQLSTVEEFSDDMEPHVEATPDAPDAISDEQLTRYIEDELAESLGGNTKDSELTQHWIKSLDYYLGRPRGDEVPGRSQVVSMDMADMVEQTLAQLMPAFSSPDLAEFEPQSEDDEDQACRESEAMNHIVLDENNGYIMFLQAIKDGLLQRAGIVKGFIDTEATVSVDTHRNVHPMQLQQVMQQLDGQDVEVVGQQENDDGSFDVQVKTITRTESLGLIPVPPEEFRVNGDHSSPFLATARFVAHERAMTQDQLIAMDYDPALVDSLPTYTRETYEQDRARSRDDVETEHESATRGGRSIWVSECYYLIDIDGDGIAERRKIVKAGNEILENDYFPIVPFAGGSPFILPHRFHGLDFFDKLCQTQDVKTAFLRKSIDNAEVMINQRTEVVAGAVNMDDLLSSRPGGVVRVKRAGSANPLVTPGMGDTGFKMLGYMDKVRKEAAGSALDAGTQENNPVAGAGAHGLERWMTSQEMLTGLIAKSFAETLIQGTYLIAHTLMREFLPDDLKFRSQGVYQETNPSQWQPRKRVAINIGLSTSERQRRYQALDKILTQQLQAMSSGADDVLTDYTKIHKALLDQARAAGLNAPEQYWINPQSDEAIEAMKGKAQSAQQQQQMQQQQMQQMAQLQIQLQQMQEETKRQGNQMDMQAKQAEYIQSWFEMELKYRKDIPGVGLGEEAASLEQAP
jgi:hypothetical protein